MLLNLDLRGCRCEYFGSLCSREQANTGSEQKHKHSDHHELGGGAGDIVQSQDCDEEQDHRDQNTYDGYEASNSLLWDVRHVVFASFGLP
jgi:hypothetical protein